MNRFLRRRETPRRERQGLLLDVEPTIDFDRFGLGPGKDFSTRVSALPQDRPIGLPGWCSLGWPHLVHFGWPPGDVCRSTPRRHRLTLLDAGQRRPASIIPLCPCQERCANSSGCVRMERGADSDAAVAVVTLAEIWRCRAVVGHACKAGARAV